MENTKKKMFLVVALSVILISLLVVVAFFLPYASAKADYRKILENFPQQIYMQEIGMTNADAMDISLLEFARVYGAFAESSGQIGAVGTIVVVMISLVGLFSLLTLIFAALRKPIVILIFNCLTFGTVYLLSWDFQDRGALPNNSYDFGMAYYIYYIGAALILAGAICMLVMKIQEKKQKKVSEISDTQKVKENV